MNDDERKTMQDELYEAIERAVAAGMVHMQGKDRSWVLTVERPAPAKHPTDLDWAREYARGQIVQSVLSVQSMTAAMVERDESQSMDVEEAVAKAAQWAVIATGLSA